MNDRLSGPALRVNPEKVIHFNYRGRPMQGVAGDTVATALYAGGVRIFSRSFKYHRPRGLYSLDGQSCTCMMEIDGIPNMKAEITSLREGMVVRSQNVLGSPQWDWLAAAEWLDWAMHPGFYYKLFHKPWPLWPVFAKIIRRAAGLGKLNEKGHPGNFENLFLNCDVCVIGGGPAGLQAALAAAEFELRVILIETRPYLGGFYDWRVARSAWGQPFWARGQELSNSVVQHPVIRVFKQTHLTGIFADNLLTAVQTGQPGDEFDERYMEIRAGSVVVATGCAERPLVFEHNERPGIMQCGCAHRLARTYGVLPGNRAVLSVGNDLMLEAAVDLADMGLKISAVADARSSGHDKTLVDELEQRNIPFYKGWLAVEARGKKGVKQVLLTNRVREQSRWFHCDLVIASADKAPVLEPLLMTHTRFELDQQTGFMLPVQLPPRLYAAGRMLGWDDPRAIEDSGRLSGLKAAADCGFVLSDFIKPLEKDLGERSQFKTRQMMLRAPGPGHKSFVCFDEDVSIADIHRVADEGFDSVELCKRYSTAGMGPSQSGIPGQNLPLVLAEYRGDTPGSLAPAKVRSPLRPTLLGTLAGKHYHRVKQTPLREIQQQLGALFVRAGRWERAQHFGNDTTAREEIANVHANVGLMDVSTLGKFRIIGKDALTMLQRIYVSDLGRLVPGQLKYSAMCNEDGCIIDDGMITKKTDGDYYFTTTSARARETMEWFGYHSRFENWDYHILNLTDGWGAVNLAGPAARQVLSRVVHNGSANNLYSKGYMETQLLIGIPVRLMRVGFVADRSYEIHAPASAMAAVWDELWDAGQEFGIKPFGLEAQNVLRLERGHIIIGEDTELRTTLLDLGLGFLWDRNKKGFKTVGVAALHQTEKQPDRIKLIGFKMNDPSQTPPGGAVIVDTQVRGHVTSVRYSQTLKQSIGLALVEEPLARAGGSLEIFVGGPDRRRMSATIHRGAFY
jgi:sarcosine oxidase subunit alpha